MVAKVSCVSCNRTMLHITAARRTTDLPLLMVERSEKAKEDGGGNWRAREKHSAALGQVCCEHSPMTTYAAEVSVRWCSEETVALACRPGVGR
jgi:hypothetical protein